MGTPSRAISVRALKFLVQFPVYKRTLGFSLVSGELFVQIKRPQLVFIGAAIYRAKLLEAGFGTPGVVRGSKHCGKWRIK